MTTKCPAYRVLYVWYTQSVALVVAGVSRHDDVPSPIDVVVRRPIPVKHIAVDDRSATVPRRLRRQVSDDIQTVEISHRRLQVVQHVLVFVRTDVQFPLSPYDIDRPASDPIVHVRFILGPARSLTRSDGAERIYITQSDVGKYLIDD